MLNEYLTAWEMLIGYLFQVMKWAKENTGIRRNWGKGKDIQRTTEEKDQNDAWDLQKYNLNYEKALGDMRML